MHPLQKTILLWYEEHGRKLPWRETQNPYKILVSEMMLQQTQVDRVIPKYHSFLTRFPTVHSLAEASPGEVLQYWSGLGYNRRALYLHQCAQALVKEKNFPETVEELQKLPGLGSYTAAAVLSFALNKDVVVIDVNISLLYKRIFFPKINVEKIALDVLPSGRSRDWHNALMDLGSLYCHRKNPDCVHCPLQKLCASAGDKKKIFSTWQRKKVQSFKSSNRIVRGVILKLLIKKDGQSIERILTSLDAQGIKREKYLFQNILVRLEEDGLIVMKEKKLFLPQH
ncbi:MAG TPA: A/G-specific adenine glycosylase [Nanoarchaeota archaeon]|nr:A/G-specific adenine glycosylase [Candidatus Woesearchaeota archaeon]HIH15049.1 A/G-specific adenine glycosylase [Nanoarchaeota archaeon]HII14240.1 A/G-specific adenine glycosylase [Nanoarchaeota archaeon]HIJ04620.1 A/G-specific adenine glycosylase [Nanoarchaeota archaeon]